MMNQLLEAFLLPIFNDLCKKYTIDYSLKSDLIVKGKVSEFQFNGLAIVNKQLGSNFEPFTNEFLNALNNNNICNCVKNNLFINITLKKEFLCDQFTHFNQEINKNKSPKTLLIDYSSPNIAKELHVGHLRSTIIGDSLANLYEFMGHNVIRVNHVGDWGGQFGMVIAYAEKHNLSQDLLDNKINISQLMEMYQKAKELSKTDDNFKNEVKKYILLLQSGNKEYLKLWEIICQISRNDYEQIYKTLNIKPIQEFGESFYNQFIPSIIENLEKSTLLKESNGAKIIECKHHPLMIVKSDGGYTYDTTDLVALWYRTQILKVNEIVYLTDAGQKTHFECLFEVANNLGWLENCQCNHIGFGLVLQDGKKISSRKSGQQEKIQEQPKEAQNTNLKKLLKDGIDEAKKIWDEKGVNVIDAKSKYLESRDEDGYVDMAINSIKYFDFTHHYQSSYDFDKEKILKNNGNTSTFVMYRYAQINNILKQKIVNENIDFDYELDIEKVLVLKVLELEHVLNLAFKTHQLNIIVSYIYELSQNFSTFWSLGTSNTENRIIGSNHEQSRLVLCSKLKKVYEIIFDILGLKLLDAV